MVTIITLEGAFASENNMCDLKAKTIEKFREFLTFENCDIVDVTSGKECRMPFGRRQTLKIVWRGNSSAVKSFYRSTPLYGTCGVIFSVDLFSCESGQRI